jgi:hypothetical protein
MNTQHAHCEKAGAAVMIGGRNVQGPDILPY